MISFNSSVWAHRRNSRTYDAVDPVRQTYTGSQTGNVPNQINGYDIPEQASYLSIANLPITVAESSRQIVW